MLRAIPSFIGIPDQGLPLPLPQFIEKETIGQNSFDRNNNIDSGCI